MRGLALEGGGAKGAFHIGVMKAFKEQGWTFEGVVGTSIGAYNAALWVQDDFDKLYELWVNMQPGDLFDIENEYMNQLANNQLSREAIVYLSGQVKAAIKNRGIDTSRLKAVLEQTINEEKLRNSEVEFGLVTVVVPHFKPAKLYKESIPEGMLKDYIMASANYPGFKLEPIESQYYMDGGLHENCPISLLIDKGYTDVIAVRTNQKSIKCRSKDNHVNIINLTPSEELGGAIIFDNATIKRNIEMGYYDALRLIKGLRGKCYYIEKEEEEVFFEALCRLSEEEVVAIGRTMKLYGGNYRRVIFEGIIPKICGQLKIAKEASYQYVSLLVLEELAQKLEIDRWHIYSLEEFVDVIAFNLEEKSDLDLSISIDLLAKALVDKLTKK